MDLPLPYYIDSHLYITMHIIHIRILEGLLSNVEAVEHFSTCVTVQTL